MAQYAANHDHASTPDTTKTGVHCMAMASGSFGIYARRGQRLVDVWFCGRKDCELGGHHRLEAEARTCAGSGEEE